MVSWRDAGYASCAISAAPSDACCSQPFADGGSRACVACGKPGKVDDDASMSKDVPFPCRNTAREV
eukprot:6114092-Amphidinium_carterae.1